MNNPRKTDSDILAEFSLSLKNLIEKMVKQKILNISLLRKYIKQENISLPIIKFIENYHKILSKTKQKKPSR